MDDNDISSACDDVNRDQQDGRGSTWTASPIALPLASYVAISGRGYTSIPVFPSFSSCQVPPPLEPVHLQSSHCASLSSPVAVAARSLLLWSPSTCRALIVHMEGTMRALQVGPGRRVQTSQLRLAPPNGITFV